MAEPGLQELADEIGLNLKKLKWVSNKFMAIYCLWILFDYKMDFSKITDSGSYNVNEVGLKIGIQHRKSFHRRIQKKFATPKKKYLMSINRHVIIIDFTY
jgi:hypothetical protein